MAYIATWRYHQRGAAGLVVGLAFGSAALASAPAWHAVPPLSLAPFAWLLFVLGAAIRFWATLYIGGRKVGGRRPLVLTTAGPYSICRNPLYWGTLLIGLSCAVMLGSVTLAAGILAGTIYYATCTIPAEEAFLRQQLGAPYDTYCRTVCRFWPRLSGYHSPRELAVDVKALANEARRASRWVWLPVALQLVATWRYESWWPRLWELP